MQVLCDVDEIDLDGDYDNTVPGICVTCRRCDHAVEVFGNSDASIRRGMVMLREECPNEESNFYIDADEKIDQSPARPVPSPTPTAPVNPPVRGSERALAAMARVQNKLDLNGWVNQFPSKLKPLACEIVEAFKRKDATSVEKLCETMIIELDKHQ
jgi:hypothetical protein